MRTLAEPGEETVRGLAVDAPAFVAHPDGHGAVAGLGGDHDRWRAVPLGIVEVVAEHLLQSDWVDDHPEVRRAVDGDGRAVLAEPTLVGRVVERDLDVHLGWTD